MCCTLIDTTFRVFTYVSVAILSIAAVSFMLGCSSSIECTHVTGGGPHCRVELSTQSGTFHFITRRSCLSIMSLYDICIYTGAHRIGMDFQKNNLVKQSWW